MWVLPGTAWIAAFIYLWSALITSSLTFSLKMLLRRRVYLGSVQMGPKKKKKSPQLCILEIPMTFASQAAKQSVCSGNVLPLLQLVGRKLSEVLCFLGRGKLLSAPGSHPALQHQPQTSHSFLGFAHWHQKRKIWRSQGCVKLKGMLVSVHSPVTWS